MYSMYVSWVHCGHFMYFSETCAEGTRSRSETWLYIMEVDIQRKDTSGDVCMYLAYVNNTSLQGHTLHADTYMYIPKRCTSNQ